MNKYSDVNGGPSKKEYHCYNENNRWIHTIKTTSLEEAKKLAFKYARESGKFIKYLKYEGEDGLVKTKYLREWD